MKGCKDCTLCAIFFNNTVKGDDLCKCCRGNLKECKPAGQLYKAVMLLEKLPSKRITRDITTAKRLLTARMFKLLKEHSKK